MKTKNFLINPSEAELAATVEENLFDLFWAMTADCPACLALAALASSGENE